MRRSADFAAVVRSGVRTRRGGLVLHRRLGDSAEPSTPIVGFVVGRVVGGSVVRHRVTRQLRAQVMARLDRFPAGSATVIRALPAAASATSAELAADLDAGLRRLAGHR